MWPTDSIKLPYNHTKHCVMLLDYICGHVSEHVWDLFRFFLIYDKIAIDNFHSLFILRYAEIKKFCESF